MTATRAALLGGGYGGASGGVVGGGIAQMFFGYDTHVLPLWVGAIVAGVLSALATRSSLCKSAAAGATPDANET